jgi:hypothetical protein
VKKAAFLLVALSLILAGCTGVPPATYCYVATASTVRAVDTGMNVAGDLYRAGKLTDEQKGKLVAVHNVYRPAAQAAVDGCKVVQNQGDADKQITLLRNAADHVIEALVAAGVLK